MWGADTNSQLAFTDVNQILVDQLSHQQSYQVHVVGQEYRIERVQHIHAVNSNDPKTIEYIAQADMVTTAVGSQILEKIVKKLAKDLLLRKNMGYKPAKTACTCTYSE